MMDASEENEGVQQQVLEFLAAPNGARQVQRIDTHGAIVLLIGDDVYKVKRAVRFSFLDYSTLEKRKAACDAELTVNRAFAPELYLGVVPITREGTGFVIGGNGDVVEWAVHLRRFDERQTLDHVADRGELSEPIVRDLARTVHEAHEHAEVRDGSGFARALGEYIGDAGATLLAASALLPAPHVEAVCASTTSALGTVSALLRERASQGYVRRCHGDLHLANVVLLDGAVTLYDAIEFSESIATTDILYDFAFLLMDLLARGLTREANALMNRYLWLADADNLRGLAAMPLFIAVRALIRARVTYANLGNLQAWEKSDGRAVVLRYFRLAERTLSWHQPLLLAVGGLSGSGKTTVARALAPQIGRLPGAVHLRSDIERKRLFDMAENDRLPPGAYADAVNRTVYTMLEEKAEMALRAGQSVIVDAVSAAPSERAMLRACAERVDARFCGLWLQAPTETLHERVEQRTGDASDADTAVVAMQSGYDVGPVDWSIIDAGQGPEAVTAQGRRILELTGRSP